MTEITARDVEHLASLARIELTPEQTAHMTTQLVHIQHLIEQVQEVATPEVEPTSHPIVMHNVFRDDEPAAPLARDEALAGAPDSDGARFRVAAILGEEQ